MVDAVQVLGAGWFLAILRQTQQFINNRTKSKVDLTVKLNSFNNLLLMIVTSPSNTFRLRPVVYATNFVTIK